jgi:membrane associated rhomboid family serine protease
MRTINRFGMSQFEGSFGPGPLTRAVKQLLIANTGLFLLTQIVSSFPWFDTFGLVPRAVLGQFRLWQLVTYLFLHGNFWHILMNMFALWMFGVPLERDWGYDAFMKFYFIVGFAAGVATWLLMLGSSTPTIGASGAIMGVLVAFALLYPDTPILLAFIIPVPARIFVLIYAVMEFLSARRFASDGIGHVTHLSGMAAAFFYLKADWRLGAVVERFRRKLRARSRGLRVVEPARKPPAPRRLGPKPGDDSEVDAILDKISREGIDSLTATELKKLRERSARH